jgi:hypothetical protein
MVEAPDPKADFAINLPRTEARRNPRQIDNRRRDRSRRVGPPGKICYEQRFDTGKDTEMRETAARLGRGYLPPFLPAE